MARGRPARRGGRTPARAASTASVAASDADGIDLGEPAGRVGDERADAEPPGIGADLVGERARWRRGGVGVAGHGAGDGVERGRAVAHRAGHDVTCHQPGPRFAVVRTERHAAARRLEPEQPARAGGDADRAATVARVRERHHARRDRGGAPAARPARRTGDVPRVVRGAVRVRFRGREEPELGRVRLADDDASRGAQLGEEVRVVIGGVAERRAAAGSRGGAVHRPGTRRGPSPGSGHRGTGRRGRPSASARARGRRAGGSPRSAPGSPHRCAQRGVDQFAW